jgi:hypothetical protein
LTTSNASHGIPPTTLLIGTGNSHADISVEIDALRTLQKDALSTKPRPSDVREAS